MNSVTILSQPPTIALLGQGLKYQLQRSYASVTGKAKLVITLPDDDTAYTDHYFEVILPERTLRFTFKDAPDETGLQILNYDSGTMTFTFFLAFVAEALGDNYYINQDYTVTPNATGIEIEAREIGSDFDLDFGATTISGASEYSNTAGIDDDTDTDYRIYAAVCLYPGTDDPYTPEPLGEENIPVTDQEVASIDMAAYLQDQLSNAFHFPYNGTNVFEVINAVVRYFIRYGEYKSEAFQKIYNDILVPHYAISGRLRMFDTDELEAIDSDYFTQSAGQRFLTWSPTTKFTWPETPERLYFFLMTTQCSLMCTAVYTDTESTFEVLTFGQDNYTIAEIHCGVSELFPGQDISDLVSYDLWIQDSKGDAVSEVRSFVVDLTEYAAIRTIFFKNSFGLFESVNCTGELSVSDNISRTTYQVLSNDAFRNRVLLAENTQEYTLNTGWLLDQDTRNWLTDLLLAKEANLVTGDQLMPVIISSDGALLEQDKIHGHNMDISFSPDYDNVAFSNLISTEATGYIDLAASAVYALYAAMVAEDEGTINDGDDVATVYAFLISTT